MLCNIDTELSLFWLLPLSNRSGNVECSAVFNNVTAALFARCVRLFLHVEFDLRLITDLLSTANNRF